MSSSFSTPATSVVFIDLATFSEQEGFLYGGPHAITWFVRGVQKSNWFSMVPIQLRSQGLHDFGQKNASASVNRSGDYVAALWFRTQIPKIALGVSVSGAPVANIFTDATIRWTRYVMHNLFEKVSITFNELTLEEFDSFWLDFNYQFRLRGSKRMGYRNMVGDIAQMYTPVGPGVALGTGGYFTCPLPFWFSEDTGVALPVAALPFNDVKVNYTFRRLDELIVLDGGTLATGGPGGPGTGVPGTYADIVVFGQAGRVPALVDPQTFATYAVVHNDERVKMGDAPRDMLIHQVQSIQQTPFKDVSTRSSFDLRLSHSIVLFCFAARNTSLQGDLSNYTTLPGTATYGTCAGVDPIAFSALLYENSTRLAMGSDYYMWTEPYFKCTAIPDETGYHIWSYAADAWLYNPAGSTNYSKLANVSIVHEMSPACIAAADATSPVDPSGTLIQHNVNGVTVNFPQTFAHIFLARNWNIARAANGSLGQPTL